MKRFTLPMLSLGLLLPLNMAAAASDRPAGTVFAVGGGPISDEMRAQFVALSPVDDPSLLIIPHAARAENFDRSVRSNTEHFRRLGLSRVTALDLNDPAKAREAIEAADLIWMPGGLQRLLMTALDEAGLADAVRDRFRAGIPVGGTSAGAAIMSDVMIASGRRDEETGLLIPIISHGLGFWPGAIVDQHFSERNRISRLEKAVEMHAPLIGVGIDESTAAIFDGANLRVSGEGTVTLVRATGEDSSETGLQRTILRAGDTYDLAAASAEASARSRPARPDRSPVAIAIHGGAGAPAGLSPQRQAEYREKLTEALRAGHAILTRGGSSLDAVEAAVRILEDSPLFNAGRGAVLTNEGTAELDASIMEGRTWNAGAIASVKHVRNPISLARQVMEVSPHVLLVGEGAEVFAREVDAELVENEYFRTERRIEQWRRARDREAAGGAQDEASLSEWGNPEFGTVGAVALDRDGNLAAATSTGGRSYKKFGRVGDSPIIGAGTWAENETCAVSATGHGEYFIRGAIAHDIAAMMRYTGASVTEAAESRIHKKLTAMGATGGVIAMDRQGNVSMPFNTDGMYRGLIDPAGNLRTAIYSDEENR